MFDAPAGARRQAMRRRIAELNRRIETLEEALRWERGQRSADAYQAAAAIEALKGQLREARRRPGRPAVAQKVAQRRG